ncbi:MAG: DnaJ domain-containing protein, partial [Pseudomonadota bacterium]
VRGQSGMSREEALQVLGLSSGASQEEVQQAHRRLLQKLHPDHGGSDYLAQRINEARDRLSRK